MTQLLHENIPFQYTEIITSDFVRALISEDKKIIICEARMSYIPIEEFKKTFHECSEIISAEGVSKFIFDKRELTSFHQPSMEWYFLTWKKDMLKLGLNQHRKVLPEKPWFRQCVEACKSQMLANADNTFLEAINLGYFDTVEDCIKF